MAIPTLLLQLEILLQIQGGLLPPPAPPPSPQPHSTTTVDPLDRGPRDLSRSLQVPELQANIQDRFQLRVAFPLVLEYLDSFHLHQELQASTPPVRERQGSSTGSTPLKQPQDSFLEVLVPIQQGHIPLAPELLLGLTQTCLIPAANQEATGCTDPEDPVPSPLPPAPDSLHFPQEDFLKCRLAPGVHLEAAVLVPTLVLLVPVLRPWVRTVGPLLLGARW